MLKFKKREKEDRVKHMEIVGSSGEEVGVLENLLKLNNWGQLY
jgi:hypothetical protein